MNFGGIKTAIRDDLSIATGDSFFSDAYIARVANRAIKWAANFHNWEETQRAVKRDSEADQEYYNYLENFKRDSIFKLTYNGDDFKKVRFRDYLKYQEDNPSGTDKIFADYRNRYFINGTIAEIVGGIVIWGHEIPSDYSDDADETPFQNQADIEEAIVKYGVGLAMKKARGSDYSRGKAEILEAITLLGIARKAQLKRQADYKTKNNQMFNRIDIVPEHGRAGHKTKRGSFNICN
jgi:hypothetical protein